MDQIHPEMASNKGVSAVIVNTDTGKVWADKAIKRCKFVPTDVQSIAKHNPSLVISSNRPAVRDTVYDGIDSKTPLQFVNENLHLSFKNIIKTRIRLLIPYNFRVMMKKVKRIIN